MKTEYIVLKETTLTNNCPECYSNDGMVLSFKQEKQKSKLLVRTKKNVIESIECSKCENAIYPGQWTMDIERVYDYHKKTITSKPSSLKFTGLFYILLFIVLAIVGVGYVYAYHPNLLGLTS
ncbi:hypothetical protein [Aquimarina celericrescens]|uniref:Uncharacterized protein n=1 Tax=Aquimarina celericrescens TaxID=1964542 RepID=A0ABW5AXB4_9FLAO|nr:hypothetical protein [Aquimarina celericrescens]